MRARNTLCCTMENNDAKKKSMCLQKQTMYQQHSLLLVTRNAALNRAPLCVLYLRGLLPFSCKPETNAAKYHN